MGEAITSVVVIGAQKIHDNNRNTNNLDFIFSHYPSQYTRAYWVNLAIFNIYYVSRHDHNNILHVEGCG